MTDDGQREHTKLSTRTSAIMPIATPAQAAAALGLTGFGAASNSSPVSGKQLGHRLGQGVPHDPHLARVEGQEEHGEDRDALGHEAPCERKKCRERDDGQHRIDSQQSPISEGRECLCEPRRIDVCELHGQRGSSRIYALVADPSGGKGVGVEISRGTGCRAGRDATCRWRGWCRRPCRARRPSGRLGPRGTAPPRRQAPPGNVDPNARSAGQSLGSRGSVTNYPRHTHDPADRAKKRRGVHPEDQCCHQRNRTHRDAGAGHDCEARRRSRTDRAAS